MTSLEPAVMERARRAYEAARLRAGFLRLGLVAVVVLAAWALHGVSAARIAVVAALLGAALVVTGWRGGSWARGALAGVLGGGPAFLVPSLLMPAGTACSHCVRPGVHWATCMATCLVVSLATGLVLAALARRDRAPRRFAAAAALTAGLTAAVTCSLAGAAGLIGVGLGVSLASLPVLAARRESRAT